jgi:hypothetical protein
MELIDKNKTFINPYGDVVKEIRLSESIFLYTNALSDILCEEIYDFYYSNRQIAAKGVTMGGQNYSVKNTFDISSTESVPEGPLRDKYVDLDNKIYQSLKLVSQAYIENFNFLAEAPNLKDTGYLWQMYEANSGFYKEHIDGECWNPLVANRVLAFVVYINTVEEGGETYFRHQNLKVKPVKGSVAVFPTSWTHPHQAIVPVSNDKLIISSFIVAA